MEINEVTGTYLKDFGGGLLEVEVGLGLDDADHWVVWEDGGAGAVVVSEHDSEQAASDAAEEYVEDQDEADLDGLIEAIKSTGYFADSDIVGDVVDAATKYAQGHLLITPDISHPVDARYATTGWLECDHITLPATYSRPELAAQALLEQLTSN